MNRIFLEIFSTLDSGRRANAESRGKAVRLCDTFKRNHQNRSRKNRSRQVLRLHLNASMRDRANRAFVAGEPGAIGVNVDGLDESSESHE